MWLCCLFLIAIAPKRGVSAVSTGDKVDNWLKNPLGNPEELGDLFEGDIALSKTKRAGLVDESRKWPNGIIPYEINGFIPYWHNVIINAMETISTRTCIKFIPKRVRDKDYVRITSNRTGCHSYIGRDGGPQILNLQVPGCVYMFGTILHELLHSVGLLHEQSRYDRDDYVEILWDNIQNDTKQNFEKVSEKTATNYGVGYDYASVMHYDGYAFSVNKERTIVAKGAKKDIPLGQRYSLTDSDARKVNAMYNCRRYVPFFTMVEGKNI